MGTTLTAALVEGDEVSLAHVGDSRAYLFRDGELKLLTSDHSLVEELRRQGRLTDEQAEDHPQRSIITRALGPEREVEVDTMTYQARPGDVYLLCSDGLTTMLREDRIAADPRRRRQPRRRGSTPRRARPTRRAAETTSRSSPSGSRRPRWAPRSRRQPTLVGPAAEEAGLTARARPRTPPSAEAGATRAALGARAAPAASARRGRAGSPASLAAVAIAAVIAGGAVCGRAPVYFLGTRLRRPAGALPRPSVRPAAGDQALLGGLRRPGPGRARSPRTGRTAPPTTRCAPTTTRSA